MPNAVMPQVQNIVFLMLENRSLDNLLGWLYTGRPKPGFVYPEGSSPDYDGLIAGKFRQPWSSTVSYPVVPVPDENAKKAVPAWDPTEEMYAETSWNGVLNQMFGNQNIITGMPAKNTPLTMQGFYQDYYADYMVEWEGKDILWTFPPKHLPVMNGLAWQFGVSDAWFCSVPTQTNPNRAYSLIGTSQGRENNQHLDAIETYKGPTFINHLADAGKSWGMYYADIWQNNQCFTEYTFPALSNAGGEIATHAQFFKRAQAGTLPEFTYLEPKWGYGTGVYSVQGTDYHPPTLVGPGETFLLNVFMTLQRSPQWQNMLFVVTFDEHGGTYDHVAPKWGAINPDGIKGSQGFDFNLFGARVPTLLISPFVRPSTVFRAPAGSPFPYDHTSFIRTFLEWAGVDSGSVNLGKRMPNAPMFDGVLTENTFDTRSYEPLQAPDYEPDPNDLGQVFEGVGFASVRHILRTNETLEGIYADVARYRADPAKFEAGLG